MKMAIWKIASSGSMFWTLGVGLGKFVSIGGNGGRNLIRNYRSPGSWMEDQHVSLWKYSLKGSISSHLSWFTAVQVLTIYNYQLSPLNNWGVRQCKKLLVRKYLRDHRMGWTRSFAFGNRTSTIKKQIHVTRSSAFKTHRWDSIESCLVNRDLIKAHCNPHIPLRSIIPYIN